MIVDQQNIDIRQHRTMGAAGFGESFAPIVQYEKWEIHPVFPHFSYFRLCQNLSPNLLAPLCGVALKNGSRGPKGTSRTECESRYLSLCFQKEYRYAYGSAEPLTGENFFLIMPYCNTVCMNIFLRELSKCYPEDIILLCCDGAAWHKSAALKLPENIVLFLIPPYTPEMNPIEQIWKEVRKRGFRNEVFATLEKVVDRLCDTICSLRINAQKNLKNRTTFHIRKTASFLRN